MVENSKKIYDLNHEAPKLTLGDLNDIDIVNIPDHDLLCGGFPCQPFSIAGKREGFADRRANVFFKVVKILKDKKPDFIILENVKNLTTHDNGNTFAVIKRKLEKHGYHLRYKVLDTCKITTVPQHRERIYIVGFRNQELHARFNLDFPDVDNNEIATYLENNHQENMYYSDRFVGFEKIQEAVTEHIRSGTLYQFRRHYVRENKSKVCPTLTANMGSGGHNVPLLLDDHGIRKLSPRECFNLQGFPVDYQLPNISASGLYTLAGNAVSVPVVELIVNRIKDIL